MTKYKITEKDRKIDSRNLKKYEDERGLENHRHDRALKRIHKKYEITPYDRSVDRENGEKASGSTW